MTYNPIAPEEQAGGTKHSQQKNRLSLLSPIALVEVGAVLTFGARKYDSHNWRKGISESYLLDATLRHLFAYLAGQVLDEESGLPHLAHAACEIMFLQEQRHTHQELNDKFQHSEEYSKLVSLLCSKPLD